MNDRYRDAVIRVALSPADDLAPPVGLAEAIHQRVLATPQQPPRTGIRIGPLRWVPAVSPATLLLLTVLALAGIVAGAAYLLTRDSDAAEDILSYRGGPGRTGVMAGPAVVNEPVLEWEVRLPRSIKDYTMPLVSGDTVYVVDVRGDAVALDLRTGQERWSAVIPADVSGTPLIAGGRLIAPADDGIVRALDLSTGELDWEVDLGARVGSSLGGLDDLAYVGADDGLLHALDLATGTERWTVDAGGPVIKAPAIEGDVAYIVVNDGPVTAFDARTGEVMWQLTDLGPGEYSTPAVHDGVLYLAHGVESGGTPYDFIAFDVATAPGSAPRELWRWRGPPGHRAFLGAITPEAAYVVSADSNAYVIDPATGEGKLLLETDAPIGSAATVVDDMVYIASQDGHVYAIDRGTQELLWTVEGDAQLGVPVVAEGRLLVGTELGLLMSFVEPPEAESG
jgi:outer membrane protein assembly factor BamB